MRERYQSMTTADGWILCAKCGHKLAKVVNINTTHTTPQRGRSEEIIELKCQSCKTLNIYGGNKNV